MIALAWIIVAIVAIALMTIVVRRLLLSATRMPHHAVLITAVLASTALYAFAGHAVFTGNLGQNWLVWSVIAGLFVGVMLTAQEIRNPHHG